MGTKTLIILELFHQGQFVIKVNLEYLSKVVWTEKFDSKIIYFLTHW